MLSKARIKFIKSLQIKKYRKQEQCFLVQGAKSVQELLHSDFEVEFIAGTASFLESLRAPSIECVEASEEELSALGEFEHNNSGLAVARMKENVVRDSSAQAYTLVLDDIRDPGNLGTIIRTADWYGIRTIAASMETADFYNPKVISATMGSFTRVTVFYVDLVDYLRKQTGAVYGAFLDGSDIHQTSFADGGLIVIGNESRGISSEVAECVTHRITIPRYGKAESLNAAIATAIILDNVHRG